MNKAQLKKVLKPLIKECIKEVVFEDGILAKVISEVISGTNQHVIKETKSNPARRTSRDTKQIKEKLSKTKKQLLEAVGNGAYNNVNVFEGTTPMSSSGKENKAASPLAERDPQDPGIDISSIPGINNWKHLIK